VKKVLVIFFFLSLITPSLAQQDSLMRERDSIAQHKAIREKNYSVPRRASLMSAILPGLGQAYNRKYWKIPIIYAGFGGLGYLFAVNQDQYKFYQKNLIAENDDDPNTTNETRWDGEDLRLQKVAYRKKRDIAGVGIALLYILNIIDANVDAHLKTFDVSDDLSLRIEPWHNIYNTGYSFRSAAGISLKLNFK